ncbi:MAG: ribonuclease III [Planctomycetota bacterium]
MASAKNRSPINSARQRVLRELCRTLEYEFSDLDILERALCHSSTTNAGKASYERLEFLGDAILGFLVADHLFNLEPEIPEGQLTDRRARIVSRSPLAAIARELKLPDYIETGRGLNASDLDSPRIHADLVEAVIGAIYLDGGIRPVRKFVAKQVIKRVGDRPGSRSPSNPKSRLLHYAQINELGQPSYRVTDVEGPDHQRVFTVVVILDGKEYEQGTAGAKQAAEMEAAEQTLRSLQVREGSPEENEGEAE